MREIEFRGRDECGRWAYGDLAHKDGFIFVDGIRVDPETVGQDTGLQAIDSNRYIAWGPEDVKDLRIFEGDIVMFPRFPENGKFVVVFYEGSFYAAELEYYGKKGIKEIPRISTYWWGDNGNRVPAIIGNVHDTPALLGRE
jgi:hypothetical protein